MDSRNPETDTNSKVNSVLTNRLYSISRNIVIVSSIALIVFLTNVDSGDYRDDFEALKTLSELKDLSVSAANQKYGFNKWLEENYPQLLQECNVVRASIVESLTQQGFVDLLKYIESRPENFSAVDFVFSDNELELLHREGSTYKLYVDTAQNVAELIDRFDIIHSPRNIAVVRNAKFPENLQLQSPQVRRANRIDGFFVVEKRDEMVLRIFQRSPRTSRIPGWYKDVSFPANIVRVGGPSLAEAIEIETPSSEELYSDQSHRSSLRAIYGNIDVKNAMSIASEQFVRSYKQVKILGMSFSAKRLPLAICAILLGLAFFLYATVRKARILNHKILSNVFEKSPIGMIIDYLPTRVIALLVLPIMAIWASHPPFPLGIVEYLLLGIGTITLGFLCVGSLLGIRHL